MVAVDTETPDELYRRLLRTVTTLCLAEMVASWNDVHGSSMEGYADEDELVVYDIMVSFSRMSTCNTRIPLDCQCQHLILARHDLFERSVSVEVLRCPLFPAQTDTF